MTLIKMLETCKGTEDGFTIRQFSADGIYDIKENLARSFFAAGFAVKFYPEKLRKKFKRKKQIMGVTSLGRKRIVVIKK